MNVILLIVAICLACLFAQAEINHRNTQRQFNNVLVQLNELTPFIVTTNTTVNELQRDLMADSCMDAGISLGELIELIPNERKHAFARHTDTMLDIVRGEN